jgi:hypothetical protein
MADEDPRGAIVYASAVRTIGQQEGVLESIRGRAGILLSAAAIATSFLVGLAIREGEGLGLWTGAASVAFGLVVAACLSILLPTADWWFRANGRKLVEGYLDADPPISLVDMHHALSLEMEEWSQKNKDKLDSMFQRFSFACIFLAVEIGLWIAHLVWGR